MGEACPLVFELTFVLLFRFVLVFPVEVPAESVTLPEPVTLGPVPLPDGFTLVFVFSLVLTLVFDPVAGLALP